jgi:hypothetical protein
MSGIDANYAGPFMQVPQQQHDATRLRDTETNRTDSARRDIARIDESLDNTVETTDESTAIDNESEGLGSQGRPFGSAEEEGPSGNDQAGDAVTLGDDGRPHLDLTA